MAEAHPAQPFVTFKKIDNSLIRHGTSFAERTVHNPKILSEQFKTNAVNIDGTFAGIDQVPGLKTTLYPHQKTAVYAMLELEHLRSFTTQRTIPGARISGKTKDYNIKYNAAVLSEPVGSGKTIDILSLILLNPIPRAMPEIMTIAARQSKPYMVINCRYKRLLKPTLIFVGSSVMKQWESAIKTFTDLKCFSVNSVKELRKLFVIMQNGEVNQYNIILVKNGKISTDIQLPFGLKLSDKNDNKSAFIYNLLDNCKCVCWARVVIDDFDTIALPNTAGVIPSLFTWFVSSTRKEMLGQRHKESTALSASQYINEYSVGCSAIMKSAALFNIFNVCNTTQYIKSATKMPRPKYHIAVFENPDNHFMNIMSSMQDDEVNRITEMLNGDAYGEAAQLAGITSNSVDDIFMTILGNKYNDYTLSSNLVDFIEYEQSEERVLSRLPMSEHEDPEARYNKKELLEFTAIDYKYPGVTTLLKDNYDQYTTLKEKSGIAIDRVKSNIMNGDCPACTIPLDECQGAIIVKCCGTVYCEECGFKAQYLNDRYNRLARGRCAQCRREVCIKDLIYIGQDKFGLADILAENTNVAIEEIAAPKECEPKVVADKYSAIMNIIKGEPVPNDKRVDMHIPNMMKGDQFFPEPVVRKVLIFANFEETLDKIVKLLKENDVQFWRLRGGIGEISRASDAFTAFQGTCAMVINSTKHCSGLNLQTATDLVFAHKMIDQAVESQVAGRGHRLGRKSPLNIWYMLYDNEYTALKKSNNVRELTDKDLEHERKLASGEILSSIENIASDDSKPKKSAVSKSKKPSKKIKTRRAGINI